MSKTIILITGANQGLGFEIAKSLSTAQQNFHVILAGRSLSKVNAAVESLESTKSSTNTLQGLELDLTSDSSIAAAVKKIEMAYGYLDVLMNNAGIIGRDPTEDLRTNYRKVFDTNVFGQAVLTDACIPLLQKSSNPRIVFMSSGLGSISDTLDPKYEFYGLDGAVYKATKAALNMMTACYAVKYGKEGFKVNSCDPGWRQTNLNNYSAGAGAKEEGAVNACRLIMGEGGENGTFSDLNGPLRW